MAVKTINAPLQHAWNYWFCKGTPTEEEKRAAGSEHLAYRQCNIKIEHEIKTVQDFWVCFLELPKPSELTQEARQGFILCRTGVRPEWEDKEMENGGVWTWIVENKCDDFWKYLLMAAIGQRFTSKDIEDDEIVAVQNEYFQGQGPTKKTKIKIWNKRNEKKDLIKDRLKELLENVLNESSLWAENARFYKTIKID